MRASVHDLYIVSIMLCIAMKETHSHDVPCVLQLATFPLPQVSEVRNYDQVNKRRLSLLKKINSTFLSYETDNLLETLSQNSLFDQNKSFFIKIKLLKQRNNHTCLYTAQTPLLTDPCPKINY